MEPMEIAKAKVLRGDIVEALYRYYGTDIRIEIGRASCRERV